MNYIKIKGSPINLDNVNSIHGLDREQGKLFFDFGSSEGETVFDFDSQEERQQVVEALLNKIGLGKG